MTRISPGRAAVVLLLIAAVGWLGWTGGPRNLFDLDAVLRLTTFRSDHPSLTATLIALTWFGSAYVTLGCAAIAALAEALRRRSARAAWLIATVGGGRLLADGLKLLIDRPRPHVAPYPVPVSSFSFPSGHAFNSMVAFGALAILFSPPRWRRAAISAAGLLAVAIGMTRPYLGVHWPSDVLAGWMLGGAVLLLAAPFRPTASRTAA